MDRHAFDGRRRDRRLLRRSGEAAIAGIGCERCRIALSARLDDEDPGVASAEVHAHLARCAACRVFEGDVDRLHRALRVTPAPQVPDLTPRILAAIDAAHEVRGPDRPLAITAHRDAWRACLAIVALVQIALALPALVLGSDAGLPVHTAHHLGSFAVALGVGFLVVAWRPERAAGLFPLVVALVACLVLTSVVDIAAGRTAAFGELSHSTELLGLALCWLVGRSSQQVRPVAGHVLPGAA
jgi:predicted anti-sigma-YlaC factor YlaD